MKVIIKPNKNDTITSKDYHSNGNSLSKMIESTNLNVKNTVHIDKIDNYNRTFLKSYAKTHKRKYYPD